MMKNDLSSKSTFYPKILDHNYSNYYTFYFRIFCTLQHLNVGANLNLDKNYFCWHLSVV